MDASDDHEGAADKELNNNGDYNEQYEDLNGEYDEEYDNGDNYDYNGDNYDEECFNDDYNGDYYDEECFNDDYNVNYNDEQLSGVGGEDDVKEEEEEKEESYGDDGWEEGFRKKYNVYPLSWIEKTHLEEGNKIIMPQSAFEELMNKGVGFPMLFKIENINNGKISHCGVLEFSSEEGVVVMPEWMMENMSLEVGGMIKLENLNLDRATYVKLQPHSVDFLNILNPKDVLEATFTFGYACLTVGDTILIMHQGNKLYVDVVEAMPSNAVCVIETDLEVDFACPLDYKPPDKPVSKPKELKQEEPSMFVPFTGSSRRLRLNETKELSAANPVLINHVDSSKSNNKIVFGVGTTTIMSNRSTKPADASLEPSNTGKTIKPFTGNKYRLMDS
ncbi:hypothetical protein SOVF_050890 [Spinacia oleracea]|uniref:Uncharacterized protein n=1 Tax=Spinacia oleracea TaxID=3562 RepID=A0A9R0IXC0_SPIOL|nr:uncharacterized protein LOC110796602 [Spinacia oleracea]KNA20594.1 hypothetical protein SOVF_050890 [Spinacia oleracea]